MRVNHAGELAAQALYHGQALVARSEGTRAMLLATARSESDHLAWCEVRLTELAARPSLLNPLWYAGSFLIGAGAALLGDRASLGFVAETERQVEGHLDQHLDRLPAGDARSRAILEAMRSEEIAHGAAAAPTGSDDSARLYIRNVSRGAGMEESIKPLSEIPAINRFLSYCRIRAVPSKTVVIHAGDLPDVLYYIISGSVEVMIEDEEGNEMVLAYLNRGQFFGEMGLFYEQPTRSAWVRTRNQCELAEMTYPRFRQIAAESPGLVFELATQLATRLDRTNRKLGDLAFVDVTGRVAHAIMDLCGEPDAMTHPEGMQIKVSRQELSRLVGCSREMAGRVLKVLEEQGLLRATGKTIVVFNARPKMKTRPVIVPAKPAPGGAARAVSPVELEDDEDDEDEDE